ncbi:MAG: hypothetical protein R3335_03690 [Anaerolineales bacterium]|nr:hypothetical protein [Anaerolineales bacterium]
MDNSSTTGELLAVNLTTEEIRRDIQVQFERLESLRSTARSILASGSLIIALISAFQIVVPPTEKIPPEAYRNLFILSLVLYVLMIASCIIALWPIRFSSPAHPGGQDLYAALKGKNELEARLALLAAYQETSSKNEAPARRVRLWTTIASLILPTVVIVLLFLSFNIPG